MGNIEYFCRQDDKQKKTYGTTNQGRDQQVENTRNSCNVLVNPSSFGEDVPGRKLLVVLWSLHVVGIVVLVD
ncbi:hypothetical protein VNO77_39275 [Canavalia gladiata]|uniref:Uncharacterized protein n=1 Tax=Canavalia gladiata TaxID=3824 RepID=A0AAN9KCU4_CANGL